MYSVKNIKGLHACLREGDATKLALQVLVRKNWTIELDRWGVYRWFYM